MKKLFLLSILLWGGLYMSVAAEKVEGIRFTIRGDIEGIAPGDTLSFERVIFPGWEFVPAFDVIVEEPNRFVYSGTDLHTQSYFMTYKPVSGKKIFTDRGGISLLIRNDEIKLKGTADNIYYSKIEGGVFDDPYLQKMKAFEDSLGIVRANFSRLKNEAYIAGDTLKGKEYGNKFNSFRLDHEAEYDRLSELEKEFYENSIDSEWLVCEMLQEAPYTPIDELRAKLERMTPEVQSSYYGKLLKQEIEHMAQLAPGNDAPDFSVVTLDGKNISLKDMLGSYVLIYHWGLCPGSLAIDRKVTEFYEKYKDHLRIIGITADINSMRELYSKSKPGDKIVDIELKPALENMLAHPWYDAESKGGNEQVKTDYAFGGLPYFVFISPEGKILARDFHDAFYKAKEIMESEFAQE